MTVKYIPRAGLVVRDDYSSSTAEQFIIEDDDPQPTGLYDANGTPLYRIRERRRIGFDLGKPT